jgi:hypothetical protein
MPKEQADRSKLFSQVKKGLSKSFDKAKTKEPVKRGQRVPGGIVRGHARLTSWTMGKTEAKGIPYLSLVGTVLTPEEFEGARLNVTHFMQPNEWNTWDDITSNLVSDLKLLGLEMDELDLDNLPDDLDGLCKEKPEFLFNTKTGKKKSKDQDAPVYVSIQGLAGDEEEEEEETEEEEEESDDEEADDEGEDSEESEGEEEAEEEDEEEADEEPDIVIPEKGDSCKFKTSPKKTELVEVMRVNKKAETVDIKIESSGKLVKGVAFSKLIWEEE